MLFVCGTYDCSGCDKLGESGCDHILVLPDQQLDDSSQAEASRGDLRFARVTNHQIKQGLQEVLSQILLLRWLEVLREYVGQDLKHRNCTAIIDDLLVLTLKTLGEHMLNQEILDSFVCFCASCGLINRVHKVLFECLR